MSLPEQPATPEKSSAVSPSPDILIVGKEFHFKEYESLRKELADLVEHSRKLEIYALGGIAAFYAWFLNKPDHPTHFALYIPMLVATLGGFRSWSVLTRIYEIAEYLRKLETALAFRDPGPAGWETHRMKKNTSPFVSSAAFFWIVLLGVSFAALCVL